MLRFEPALRAARTALRGPPDPQWIQETFDGHMPETIPPREYTVREHQEQGVRGVEGGGLSGWTSGHDRSS
ncbi:hypothetical protein [Streptomyces sp. HUCO-GS316]|uniref:hypothetical protein n=1 Tax=Streptomyces sp. HUCO-GS316 TaxID=2692198 RepID=UPI00301C1040